MNDLKPMDVYSEMTIPFDVAAYCRGHKLCVQSVNLARAIERRKQAERALAVAESYLEAAEDAVREALASVREKMEKDPI